MFVPSSWGPRTCREKEERVHSSDHGLHCRAPLPLPSGASLASEAFQSSSTDHFTSFSFSAVFRSNTNNDAFL